MRLETDPFCIYKRFVFVYLVPVLLTVLSLLMMSLVVFFSFCSIKVINLFLPTVNKPEKKGRENLQNYFPCVTSKRAQGKVLRPTLSLLLPDFCGFDFAGPLWINNVYRHLLLRAVFIYISFCRCVARY